MLLDKMCKYGMDPASIVEDTERARFCPPTDRQTNGRRETSKPTFQLRWSGGYNYFWKCKRFIHPGRSWYVLAYI